MWGGGGDFERAGSTLAADVVVVQSYQHLRSEAVMQQSFLSLGGA